MIRTRYRTESSPLASAAFRFSPSPYRSKARCPEGPLRCGLALVLGLLVAFGAVAGAQPTRGPAAETPAVPVPEADPDGARAVVQWRGAMRATIGLALPLVRSTPITLDLLPRVELHEPPGSSLPLPNQFWRGLVGLRLRYAAALGAQKARFEAQLFHESDHETAHPYAGEPGFLTLNGLALGLVLTRDMRPLRLQAAVHGRLYVHSCTRRPAPCRNFNGSTALGGALSLAVLGPDLGWAGLAPFAAIFGSGVLPGRLVRGERRIVLHAGLQHPMPAGHLRWFAGAWLGHDVGITRNRTFHQWTAGLAWQLTL